MLSLPILFEKHAQLHVNMFLCTSAWLFLLPLLTSQNPLPSLGIESLQITKEGSAAHETAEGITASTRAPFHDKLEEPFQQQKNVKGLRQRKSQANSVEPHTSTSENSDIPTQESQSSETKSVRERIWEKLDALKLWCKRLLSYLTSMPKKITTYNRKIKAEKVNEKSDWWDRFSTWLSNTLPSRREAARIQRDNELARFWREQKKPRRENLPTANQEAGIQAPRTGHASEKASDNQPELLRGNAAVASSGVSPPVSQVPSPPNSNRVGNKMHPIKTSDSRVESNGLRPLKEPTKAMARQRSQALASTFVDESPSQEQRADVLRRRTLQTLRSLNLPEADDIPTTKLEYLPGFVQSSNIKGDGNCQFRAVSQLVYGTQERHLLLREQAVAWLRRNPDTVKSFMTAEAADPHLEQKLEAQNGKPIGPQKTASSTLQHGKTSTSPNRGPPEIPQGAKPIDPSNNPFIPSSSQTQTKSKSRDGISPSQLTSKDVAPPNEESIVERYCQYMGKPGVFGDDYTLFALAEVTELDLVCVSATDAGLSISQFTKRAPQESHQWKGLYHHPQHYEVLLKDIEPSKPTEKLTNTRPPTWGRSPAGKILKKLNHGSPQILQVKQGNKDISSYKFKLPRPSYIPTEKVVPGVVASTDLIAKSNESQFFVWQFFTHHSNDDRLAHSCRTEAYQVLKERPDIFEKVENLPQFQEDWNKKFPGYEYNQERYLELLRAGAISEDIMTLSALAELKNIKFFVYENIGDKAPSTLEIIPKKVEDQGWIGLIKKIDEKFNDNYQLLYKA